MKSYKMLAGLGAGLLVVAALLILYVGPIIAERLAFRGQPELKAEYRDFKSKDLTIPADALTIAQVSEETQAAAEKIVAMWATLKDQATVALEAHDTSLKISAPAVDAAALQAALAPFDPLLEEDRKLVASPDYEMSVFVRADGKLGVSLPIPNFYMLQSLAKLSALKGLAESAAGRPAEGIAWTEAALRSAKTHPCDILISQLIAIAIRSIGIRAEAKIVSATSDPTALRGALDALKALDNRAPSFESGLTLSAIDAIGEMRMCKRLGVSVGELAPMTERELSGLQTLAKAKYGQEIFLPKAQSDPEAAANAQTEIANDLRIAAMCGKSSEGAPSIFSRIQAGYFLPMLFAIARPNFKEAHMRERIVSAQFDLLRLETARRLYEVEKGKAPENLSMLAPEYLAEIPADRFGKNGDAYRMAGGTIYSVGPDGADQSAATLYDPSNGATSSGDLYLAAGKLETASADALPK